MELVQLNDVLNQMQKNLECAICLELLNNPVSTNCEHLFCKFCITKFLQNKRSVQCPLCKEAVTKRALRDRSELDKVVKNVQKLIAAVEKDTGQKSHLLTRKSSEQVENAAEDSAKSRNHKGFIALSADKPHTARRLWKNSTDCEVEKEPGGIKKIEGKPEQDHTDALLQYLEEGSCAAYCEPATPLAGGSGEGFKQKEPDKAKVKRGRLRERKSDAENSRLRQTEKNEMQTENSVVNELVPELRHRTRSTSKSRQPLSPRKDSQNTKNAKYVVSNPRSPSVPKISLSPTAKKARNIRPNNKVDDSSIDHNKEKICAVTHQEISSPAQSKTLISPLSSGSSISSTQQLAKPMQVVSRTYSKDMQSAFRAEGGVRNWTNTLSTTASNCEKDLSHLRGLTTKEKIRAVTLAHKQGPMGVSHSETDANVHVLEPAHPSISECGTPLACTKPIRKCIFRARCKNGTEDTKLPPGGTQVVEAIEDPYEFTGGQTPTKEKKTCFNNKRNVGKTESSRKQKQKRQTSARKAPLDITRSSVVECSSTCGDSKRETLSSFTKLNGQTQQSVHEEKDTFEFLKPRVSGNKKVHFSLVHSGTDGQTAMGAERKGAILENHENTTSACLESGTENLRSISCQVSDLYSDVHCEAESIENITVTTNESAQAISGNEKLEVPEGTGIRGEVNGVAKGQHCEGPYGDGEVTVHEILSGDEERAVQESKKRRSKRGRVKTCAEQASSCPNTLVVVPGDLSETSVSNDSGKQNVPVHKLPTVNFVDGKSKYCSPKSGKGKSASGRKKKSTKSENLLQKSGKELEKLQSKISEAEDYELMFSTQDAQKNMAEVTDGRQGLFGFEELLSEGDSAEIKKSVGMEIDTDTYTIEESSEVIICPHSSKVSVAGSTAVESSPSVDDCKVVCQERAGKSVEGYTSEANVEKNITEGGASSMNSKEEMSVEPVPSVKVCELDGKIASSCNDVGNVEMHLSKKTFRLDKELEEDTGHVKESSKFESVKSSSPWFRKPAHLEDSYRSEKSVIPLHEEITPLKRRNSAAFPRPDVTAMIQVSPGPGGILSVVPSSVKNSPGLSVDLHVSPTSAPAVPRLTLRQGEPDMDITSQAQILTLRSEGIPALCDNIAETEKNNVDDGKDLDSYMLATDTIPDENIDSTDGTVILETMDMMGEDEDEKNSVKSSAMGSAKFSRNEFPVPVAETQQSSLLLTQGVASDTVLSRNYQAKGSSCEQETNINNICEPTNHHPVQETNTSQISAMKASPVTKAVAALSQETLSTSSSQSQWILQNDRKSETKIVLDSPCLTANSSVLCGTPQQKADDSGCVETSLPTENVSSNSMEEPKDSDDSFTRRTKLSSHKRKGACTSHSFSSAPSRFNRFNFSDSEDEDQVLIVRRPKRKCFSLDGSPIKPVVFRPSKPECSKFEGQSKVVGEIPSKCSLKELGSKSIHKGTDSHGQDEVRRQENVSCVSGKTPSDSVGQSVYQEPLSPVPLGQTSIVSESCVSTQEGGANSCTVGDWKGSAEIPGPGVKQCETSSADETCRMPLVEVTPVGKLKYSLTLTHQKVVPDTSCLQVAQDIDKVPVRLLANVGSSGTVEEVRENVLKEMPNSDFGERNVYVPDSVCDTNPETAYGQESSVNRSFVNSWKDNASDVPETETGVCDENYKVGDVFNVPESETMSYAPDTVEDALELHRLDSELDLDADIRRSSTPLRHSSAACSGRQVLDVDHNPSCTSEKLPKDTKKSPSIAQGCSKSKSSPCMLSGTDVWEVSPDHGRQKKTKSSPVVESPSETVSVCPTGNSVTAGEAADNITLNHEQAEEGEADGNLPLTSSALQDNQRESMAQDALDHSLVASTDNCSEEEEEEDVCLTARRKVKRQQITSDSDSSDNEDGQANQTMNNSSSALSTQSEILTTQQRETLEDELAKLHQEIIRYEAKLHGKSSISNNGHNYGDEENKTEVVVIDESPCAGATSHNDTDDEDSSDLFISPSPSPPKPVSIPRKPAMSSSAVIAGDEILKQFQSPGGTVRTKKSLDFVSAEIVPRQDGVENAQPLRGKGIKTEEMKLQNCRNVVTADIDACSSSTVARPISPVLGSQKQGKASASPATGEVVQNKECLKEAPRNPEKELCFVASGLTRKENLMVLTLVEQFGATFSPKFVKGVTHVIMKPVDPAGRVCDRTLKFFQGIAHKCWVVGTPWVAHSLKAGQLLPEEDYEISGDTSGGDAANGAARSRLSQQNIFSDFCFAFVGSSEEMSKECMQELVTACGACTVNNPVALAAEKAKYKLIIRCADSDVNPNLVELDMLNGFYQHMSLVSVMREWILDSLGAYTLQPLADYIINSGQHILTPF